MTEALGFRVGDAVSFRGKKHGKITRIGKIDGCYVCTIDNGNYYRVRELKHESPMGNAHGEKE